MCLPGVKGLSQKLSKETERVYTLLGSNGLIRIKGKRLVWKILYLKASLT